MKDLFNKIGKAIINFFFKGYAAQCDHVEKMEKEVKEMEKSISE